MWSIECEPHVAIRVKRVFPKAKPSSKVIQVSALPEASEELRWFLSRFPLEMSKKDQATLNQLADQYLESRQKVQSILCGSSAEIPEMALPARPYQAQASELTYTTGRLLLADELGIGKTVSALSLLARKGTLPAVVVMPTHLPLQWQREFARFLPALKTYIIRTGSREREKNIPNDVDVWLVPYSRIRGWSHVLDPKSIIFDEVHELRRDSSDKYSAARELADKSTYKIGLSATPVWNYGAEFYSVLGILAPGELGTWDEFTREWCDAFRDAQKAKIRDPVAFGSWLRDNGLLLRRTRREVGRELPPIVRSVVPVEWDNTPIEEIETAMIELASRVLTSQGREVFQASGDLDARLRAATGRAKAMQVAALVRSIVETSDESLVLFGWHRDVYDIWLKALADLNPVMYTGSEDAKAKDANLKAFINGESKVLIMSLRSGQGVDGLQGICHRVVVGELDWSPGALEQCVGRVHRDGQAEPTLVYYAVCDVGCDPVMLDILDLKRWQVDGVVDPKGEKVLDLTVDPHHVKKLAEDLLRRRGIDVNALLQQKQPSAGNGVEPMDTDGILAQLLDADSSEMRTA